MRPRVGLRNLVSRLKQVVLPAPFGPIRACTVPRATFRLMPLTATNPAKSLVRSSVSRTVSALIDRTFPWSSRCSRVRTAPLSRRGRNTDRYHLVAISSLGVAPGMCSHRAHRRSGARWWWWFSAGGGNRLSGNQCAWHLADTFSAVCSANGRELLLCPRAKPEHGFCSGRLHWRAIESRGIPQRSASFDEGPILAVARRSPIRRLAFYRYPNGRPNARRRSAAPPLRA